MAQQFKEVRKECPTCSYRWLDKYGKNECPKCLHPLRGSDAPQSQPIGGLMAGRAYRISGDVQGVSASPRISEPNGMPAAMPEPKATMPGEEAAMNVFLKYASIGKTGVTLATAQLDGSKWAKLCRESGLQGPGLSAMDVEAIYMRISRTSPRIGYQGFLAGLEQIAEKKKTNVPALFSKLAEADPTAGVTKAEYVKFHDDKALYTGVYRMGGPANLAGSK